MRSWDTVAIVGVGLIGGSIGLALRQRNLAQKILGVGRRRQSLEKALALGCITEIAADSAAAARQADLVIVCTPVETIAQQVLEAARSAKPGCLITDAGSTKEQLVAEIETALATAPADEVNFVGSHPIAGSEKNGPAAADPNLFDGRVTVVTPTERSDPTAVAAIEEFWKSIGARVMKMDPREHDAIVARTSHLPHLVASALAATTPGNDECLPLTGSGWADTTRIASGDPELWRQILLTNRRPTLSALADFETVLRTWRHALESGNGQLLTELLKEGKTRRDAMGS
jgi:prephenate dehydrogenase